MYGLRVKESGIRVQERSFQHDRGHEPTVVRLLAMRRAAVAEEPPLVGVGVETEILEAADPRARRALGDKGVEGEHRVASFPAWGEIARRVLARSSESGDELRTNLVGRLADAGPERGG